MPGLAYHSQRSVLAGVLQSCLIRHSGSVLANFVVIIHLSIERSVLGSIDRQIFDADYRSHAVLYPSSTVPDRTFHRVIRFVCIELDCEGEISQNSCTLAR